MSQRWRKPSGKMLVAACLGAAALALSLAWPAWSAEPQDRVRLTLEAVAAVVSDPALQGSARAVERQQRVRAIIYEAFDFPEMAKEVLGPQWAKLTPPQQAEFVDLFGTLFERSYNRLVVRFLGERRTLYGAEAVDNTRASVQTTLVSKNDARLPIDYHLAANGGRWAIYDVVIDGVSLATNYRAQFAKILRSASFEALVQRIKAKLAEEPL
jgi:phospholipid transport system substrate-binding protein